MQQGMAWPDERFLALFGVELPIAQAPMAGASDVELAIAVAEAGGLGSVPCGMLVPEQVEESVRIFRARVQRPIHLNFFCHEMPRDDPEREAAWRESLRPHYEELDLDPTATIATPLRVPFDSAMCDVVEATRPEVVSFHFGLPSATLLERVKATGAKVLSSATTLEEGEWLEARGVDAIIAQGAEAGGHSGTFLAEIGAQTNTFALVPLLSDALRVPVIAAGGIADGRGIAAAFALGACGVQIGTAYLLSKESKIGTVHRAALAAARGNPTRETNALTGRLARGILNRHMRETGFVTPLAPTYPLAANALAPLRKAAEQRGLGDFSPNWAGQAVALAREAPAAELTRRWAAEALSIVGRST